MAQTRTDDRLQTDDRSRRLDHAFLMSQPPQEHYPRTIRRTARQEVLLQPSRRNQPRLKTQSIPLLLVAGFGVASLFGAVLLSLPVSSSSGEWTSPIDALFVATSAVCVTGLTPVDTGTYWSGFGQVVILLLFQFGGLGFMTSATLLFLLFGWRVGVRERLLLSQTLDLGRMGGVVRLIRRTVTFALIAEAIGFAILFLRFLLDHPIERAAWYGLFHSVSAFNNAGFDLFGNFQGLAAYDDVLTLTTIAALAFLGSIGYPVIEDLRQRRRASLFLDTRIVLRTTFAVIGVVSLLVLALEWDGALAGRGIADKILQSAFHAVASRTSGFAALPAASMSEEILLITMAAMFIGGASGSTAGGIKVGTFGILLAATWSAVASRSHVEAEGREIRRPDVDRALALTIIALILVFTVAVGLARLEEIALLHLLFEATSAFGTAGLSTGVTPALGDAGMLLITATMFVGRLGPLTLALVLVQRSRLDRIRLPEERVRIG
ncbi:MAG: Trk family potassium uptake protein [Dehalococcoidia bacterium]|nr:Trk family potassium uptake protein [Dehalococcoidia bacterium]